MLRKGSKEGSKERFQSGTLSKTAICSRECLRRVLLNNHPRYSSWYFLCHLYHLHHLHLRHFHHHLSLSSHLWNLLSFNITSPLSGQPSSSKVWIQTLKLNFQTLNPHSKFYLKMQWSKFEFEYSKYLHFFKTCQIHTAEFIEHLAKQW